MKRTAEFWVMFAVIAITAWHVRGFLATKDHELASWIIGLVIGLCNFLFAHRLFSGKAPGWAFTSLCIGAAYSVFMQYVYFDQKDLDSNSIIYYFYGWNLEALVLAVWAPTFEILLGFLYSAMQKDAPQVVTESIQWSAVTGALVNRAVDMLQPKEKAQLQAVVHEGKPAKKNPAKKSIAGSQGKALQAQGMKDNDMKVKDIATSLQVSERQVYNLLNEAKELRKVHPVSTNGHTV